MTQADSPLQMEEPLAGDTEIGIRYSMGGMGSAGYLLFFFANSIFTVALIYLAWHQENNFLLWLLAATSGLLSMVFLTRGMGDAWRITTKTWGFEAWDGGLIAVRWEEVASYHHDDTGDSLEYLKIRFKPGASCRRDLSIDVTNLEPPVEQLLRTFAHAAARKN